MDERKLIWVVGSEADNCVGVVLKHNCISLHRILVMGPICTIPFTSTRQRSLEDLELMAVKMPRMKIGVVIVDDNLDDTTVWEDEWIDVTIDGRVRGELLVDCQSRVKGWHLLRDVSIVVDGKSSSSVR
jgi:hypothetical protein